MKRSDHNIHRWSELHCKPLKRKWISSENNECSHWRIIKKIIKIKSDEIVCKLKGGNAKSRVTRQLGSLEDILIEFSRMSLIFVLRNQRSDKKILAVSAHMVTLSTIAIYLPFVSLLARGTHSFACHALFARILQFLSRTKINFLQCSCSCFYFTSKNVEKRQTKVSTSRSVLAPFCLFFLFDFTKMKKMIKKNILNRMSSNKISFDFDSQMIIKTVFEKSSKSSEAQRANMKTSEQKNGERTK